MISQPNLEWTSALRLRLGDRLLVAAVPARLATVRGIERGPKIVTVTFASGKRLELGVDHEILRAK